MGDFKTGGSGNGGEKERAAESPGRIHLILQIGLQGCEVDHDDDFHHRPPSLYRRLVHIVMELVPRVCGSVESPRDNICIGIGVG